MAKPLCHFQRHRGIGFAWHPIDSPRHPQKGILTEIGFDRKDREVLWLVGENGHGDGAIDDVIEHVEDSGVGASLDIPGFAIFLAEKLEASRDGRRVPPVFWESAAHELHSPGTDEGHVVGDSVGRSVEALQGAVRTVCEIFTGIEKSPVEVENNGCGCHGGGPYHARPSPGQMGTTSTRTCQKAVGHYVALALCNLRICKHIGGFRWLDVLPANA